ncbi:MAG TPA: glycosyltransferase family 39 protein [Armatimonadota bacterium]|nr:glycosyltransferase family 39 protein [Armatimonadota bacterium]
MFERLGRLSTRTQQVILLIGCVLLYCVCFTRIPLTEIDEVRYTEATREMLTNGQSMVPPEKTAWIQHTSAQIAGALPGANTEHVQQWMLRHYYHLIPYFNFHPRYQKPVLYYWIQAASVRLFGFSEWAARLPSAILAIILVLVLHAFLLAWLPRRFSADDSHMRARGIAFLGAAAFATMPLIAIWTRAATTDMTLTFFTTWAVLAMMQADLVRAAGEDDANTRVRRCYLSAACAIGLAALTKGPVGLAVPGLSWLIYHGMQRNLAAEAKRVPWGVALVVFAIIAVPWYIVTYYMDGAGFLRHFFLNENLNRFAGTAMEGHGSDNRLIGLLLYIPMALITLFPYSPTLVRELLTPFAGNQNMTSDVALTRMRRFAWVWFATVVGMFSLSKTQLPSYIQSVSAAAAILFALHVLGRIKPDDIVSHAQSALARWGRWLEFVLLLIPAIVFVAAPVVVLALGKVTGPLGIGLPLQQTWTWPVMIVFALCGLVWIGGLIAYHLRQRDRRLMPWMAAGWVVIYAILIFAIAPLAVNSEYHYSVTIGRYLGTFAPDQPVMTFCKHTSESLVYYSRRPIGLFARGKDATSASRIAAIAALNDYLAEGKRVIVVTDDTGMEVLRPLVDLQVLRNFDHQVHVLYVTQKTR